jgi:hypothetical protein
MCTVEMREGGRKEGERRMREEDEGGDVCMWLS